METYLLAAAVVMDTVIGDPRISIHPVVLIGNLIGWLEKILYGHNQQVFRQKVAGALLVILVLTSVYGVAWALTAVLSLLPPMAGFLGSALLLSFTISPRSLAEAGNEIRKFLLSGNLEQARFKVGWIVGRDTDKMSVAEVTRATVETVAENIVDGIISPLFYAAIGGVPLAFLYRAVNTLDSMVGYKNDKYRHFGMVAARVDDVFNYIPARINGLLVFLSALLLGYNVQGAIKAVAQDAAKHPSPNSGIAEAGVAGALGIRLGGLNYYGGVPSQRAVMGHGTEDLKPEHITKTIKMMYASTLLFTAAILLIYAIMIKWGTI